MNTQLTTWRKELGDILSEGYVCTLSEAELDEPFDNRMSNLHCPEPRSLRLWTEDRVYFTLAYDGGYSITLESVARNPGDGDEGHVET